MKIINNLYTPYIYNIIIIGAGGTGSHLISYVCQLAHNKENIKITIIDGDKIENKNLLNQKFLKKQVGKYKAEVLADRYSRAYPDIKINYMNRYIKDKNFYKDIIDYNNIPIIIGCVDNNQTRVLLTETFKDITNKTVLYIDSGNGTIDRYGQIIVGYRKNKVIYSDPVGTVIPSINDNKDSIDKVLSCSYNSGKYPQNIGTNILAATSIYTLLNNIISFNELPCTRIFFDAEQCTVYQKMILSTHYKKALKEVKNKPWYKDV